MDSPGNAPSETANNPQDVASVDQNNANPDITASESVNNPPDGNSVDQNNANSSNYNPNPDIMASESANNPQDGASLDQNNANPDITASEDFAASSSQRGSEYDGQDCPRKCNRKRRRGSSRGRDRNSHTGKRVSSEELTDDEEQLICKSRDSSVDPNPLESRQHPLGISSENACGMMIAMNSSHLSIGLTEGTSYANPRGAMNLSASYLMNCPGSMPVNPNLIGCMGPNLSGSMGPNIFGSIGMFNDSESHMVSNENILHFSKCILYPPQRPPIPTRSKPPGCKTVFVSNLPDNVTEEIIREVFNSCGKILSIQMTKENFCHIRFLTEGCAENAVGLNGYRMKMKNEDDATTAVILYVDYAVNPIDQCEFNCRCSVQRRARCSGQTEQPLPCSFSLLEVPFSDNAVSILNENLTNEETVQEDAVIPTETTGEECSKTSCDVSCLPPNNLPNKEKSGETPKNADPLDNEMLHSISVVHAVVENCEMDVDTTESTEVVEDEMSDENRGETTNNLNEAAPTVTDQNDRELYEIDGQLEAFENRLILVKAETDQECGLSGEQSEALDEAGCGMQRKPPIQKEFDEYEADAKVKKENERDSAEQDDYKSLNAKDTAKYLTENQIERLAFASFLSASPNSRFSGATWLVCLISTFLNIHPAGASLDYICSWLREFDNTIQAEDVENLMQNHPELFSERCPSSDGNSEKKWRSCGF